MKRNIFIAVAFIAVSGVVLADAYLLLRRGNGAVVHSFVAPN